MKVLWISCVLLSFPVGNIQCHTPVISGKQERCLSLHRCLYQFTQNVEKFVAYFLSWSTSFNFCEETETGLHSVLLPPPTPTPNQLTGCSILVSFGYSLFLNHYAHGFVQSHDFYMLTIPQTDTSSLCVYIYTYIDLCIHMTASVISQVGSPQ